MRTQTQAACRSIAAGAIGGLVASLAMNQFQSALSAVSESMAKRERRARAIFDHRLAEDEKQWAGPAVHYGFGATLGALHGSLAPCTTLEAGAGTGFGAAVWLGADEIAVPFFGLCGPPSETPLPGDAKALASHLLFGVVTHLTRTLC